MTTVTITRRVSERLIILLATNPEQKYHRDYRTQLIAEIETIKKA